MKYDLVISGVGGQGILSIAFVIDHSALAQGLHFKQAELHGMAQRGGAVSSHLRLADGPIFSDVVALGSAQMLLSMEPMEVLRHRGFLAEGAWLVTSVDPEVNIPDYPREAELLASLTRFPGAVLVHGVKVARECGSHRACNMVVLGAAAPYLPLGQEVMERFIKGLFARKGETLVATNIKAFRAGMAHGQLFRAAVDAGADPARVLTLGLHLHSESLDPGAADLWTRVMGASVWSALTARWEEEPKHRMAGDRATAEALLNQGMAALS